MRPESPCAVCCCSLCQHPECWRASLQQVRDAVWRRNGVQPPESSRSSVDIDSLYLRKNQSDASEGLPSLKVVDMFSDMGGGIANTPRKPQEGLNHRSSSLPCLPYNIVSPVNVPSVTKTPQHSPATSSPPLTEYQRRMRWKQQITSRLDTSTSENSGKSVKLANIGIHELYEPDEMDQEWQEVYVTSAYLVWCPSNKKRRKAKRRTSRSSSVSSSNSQPKKILPKDVTEDLVPAALETFRPPRPKSTKTPTGGQPFSPHRPPQQGIVSSGMEDPDRLPKPVLSGILKRITWSSNQASPLEDKPDDIKDTEEEETLEETLSKEQSSSKVCLAVDINSRFTSPEEDKQIEKQRNEAKQETSIIDKIKTTTQTASNETSDNKTYQREPLSMHPVGLPVGDLPELEYHHCTSSIPRRLNLGIALEPVDLVPVTPSPSTTPKKISQDEISVAPVPVHMETSKPYEQASLVVNIPSGRPESAPAITDQDKMFYDSYYINNAFRYTPSPVRAPAPTPISPDKYAEFSRFSRASHRRSSLHDDQPFKAMHRWNTLSSVYDTEYQHTGQDTVLSGKMHDVLERQGVFLTEGVEMESIAPPITPRCRSPSPGSRTCIPKDIIEQFQGDIYGRKMNAAQADDKLTSKVLSNVSSGFVPRGWRPPRSRTPIQLAETPARYPPRPLRQPPIEAIPKSLQIVSIRKPMELVRCKSTPPHASTPDHELLPLVLSDTSLPTNSTVSMEVKAPSSVMADSGVVPAPPPSPEAATTLKNDLQPTLETLCEEDERSSRNTSIADVVEKDVALSRLSPLGWGSEMSDESVELPAELNEIEEEERTTQQLTQETTAQQGNEKTSTQQTIEKNPVQDVTNTKEERSIIVDKEQIEPETQSNKHDSIEDNPSTDINTTAFEKADEQAVQKASEYDQLEKFTGELFSMDMNKSGLAEPELQEDITSPDLQPPRGTPEPTENKVLQRQTSTEELPDQPPGSPDFISTQDFTDGLDMGLDLAAELQAAMEGLDDFDIGDDDDENNGVDET